MLLKILKSYIMFIRVIISNVNLIFICNVIKQNDLQVGNINWKRNWNRGKNIYLLILWKSSIIHITPSDKILFFWRKSMWQLKLDIKLNLWLNISKGTSCRKTRIWVMEMQSQNTWKYGPKVNFEISHILESSVLNLDQNSIFMYNWTSELLKYQYFVQLPKF